MQTVRALTCTYNVYMRACTYVCTPVCLSVCIFRLYTYLCVSVCVYVHVWDNLLERRWIYLPGGQSWNTRNTIFLIRKKKNLCLKARATSSPSALSPHMSTWKRLSPHKWSDKTSFSVTRTRLHPKPSEKGVESFASENNHESNNKHESNNRHESNNKHATNASYLRFIHLHCRHAPLAFAETEEKLWWVREKARRGNICHESAWIFLICMLIS